MYKKLYTFIFAAIFFIPAMSQAKCKAILVNGGVDSQHNFNIHTTELREMYRSLLTQGCQPQDIYVFSASGKTDSYDVRVDPIDPDSEEKTEAYKFVGNKTVQNLYPADKETLEKKMTEIAQSTTSGDHLFIYLNDHGTNGLPSGVGMMPWLGDDEKPETVNLEEFQKIISQTSPDAKVKVWADCCYCGVYNRVKSGNTCVASATDEFHVGDYFWSNWDAYIKNGAYNGPITPTVKAAFAGQIKSENSSLAKAASVSKLSLSNPFYTRDSMTAMGCFMGPRDSAERFMYETIGRDMLCVNDVLGMVASSEKAPSEPASMNTCENPDQRPFNKLRDLLLHLGSGRKLSASDTAKIKKLAKKLQKSLDRMKSSKEQKQLDALDKKFEALSPEEQVKQAADFQEKSFNLRGEMADKDHVYDDLMDDQKLITEALFYGTANDAQKKEYKRLRSCLEEPIF